MNDWTKKVHALALESRQIPMWGSVPSFPWDDFNERLSQGLTLSDLTVTPGTSEWRSEEELFSGLGDHVQTLSIELSPLEPPLYLVVPGEDISRISSWLIPEGGFTDPDLQKGFYYYLGLQALQAAHPLHTLKNLSPKIVEKRCEAKEGYCIDLAMTCQGMTAWGRLILSKPLHEALISHFASHPLDLAKIPLSQELPLSLSIEAGKTLLTQEELLSLSEGDFLLIDNINYRLSLAGTPLLQIQVMEKKGQILQPATFEEEITMTDSNDLLNPSEVPLILTVEIARIEMPLSHLLALKPGNTLDLENMPRVSLTVQGKCIAKGELLKIGDVTGVKITEVGHG